MNVIIYSDFVEHCSKYAYHGTVKTVPYELSVLIRVIINSKSRIQPVVAR